MNLKLKNGTIRELFDNETTIAPHNFLRDVLYIEKVRMSKLKRTYNGFLLEAKNLIQIDLPIVEEFGDFCLVNTQRLVVILLPQLRVVGHRFLALNRNLPSIDLPELVEAGGSFLAYNRGLVSVSLPKLAKVGRDFLVYGGSLTTISLPELVEAGESCFGDNKTFVEVSLPKLAQVGTNFISFNSSLKRIDLPELRIAKRGFLSTATNLEEINLPNLEYAGYGFIGGFSGSSPYEQEVIRGQEFVKRVKGLNFPKLTVLYPRSLLTNEGVEVEVKLGSLERVGTYILESSEMKDVYTTKELRDLENKCKYNPIAWGL